MKMSHPLAVLERVAVNMRESERMEYIQELNAEISRLQAELKVTKKTLALLHGSLEDLYCARDIHAMKGE